MSVPDKSVYNVAFNKCRVASEPNNIASLIDCRRRVPPLGAEVSEINHAAIFPEHCMLRRVPSNSLVANARNAYNLAVIVGCRGSP